VAIPTAAPAFGGRNPLRAFRAWRSYNYRIYWWGLFVSQTGAWMRIVAVSWLVLTLTNSALAVGTVTALQFLPTFLGAPLAGAVIDRLPKRRLLLATQCVMLAVAVALTVLSAIHRIQVLQVYGLVFVLGMGNLFDNPTRQAFLIELVGVTDLPSAVALNSAQFQSARMLGPALGGTVIAAWGITACFALSAISSIAIFAALLAMRPGELRATRPATSHTSLLSQVAEAIVHVRHTPRLLLPLSLLGVIGTFGFNFSVLLPVLARNELAVGARGYGLLGAALGLGALSAAFTLAYVGRANWGLLLSGAVAFGSVELAMATSHLFLLSAVLLVLLGMASVLFASTTNSLVQLAAPEQMRGRIMALYTLLFLGTGPVGALFTGAIASRWGALAAFAVCGAISLSAALIASGYVALKARQLTAERSR
jgi:MFS family permease